MRYHSLVIDPTSLPTELAVSARTADGVIMAVRHKSFPVEGVQFHPESILAEDGKKLLKNFLDL
jgi:anthranilate/para-aminobenzoate synthase component II